MNEQRAYSILKAPLITEKATLAQAKSNQYVFRVATDATKPEIKNAVEKLFNVTVLNVTVTNVKGQVRQFARMKGRTKSWKKAYVTLESGQMIDVAGVQA